MDIINRTVIKKYDYAQVNLVMDSNGDKFIEKIQFSNPPMIPLTFQYHHNELEIIEFIIKPLEIPHARIIDSAINEKCITFVMDYISGIECEDEPKAEYLYIAAEKLGTIYSKSKINMPLVDKVIVEKYTLCKERILEYIKVISKYYYIPHIDPVIDYIFNKYHNRTIFVNHHDIQFKNFIYNGDLYLIDWDCVKIHPFFSDLYSLIQQADQVNADIDEIKKRYLKFSQRSSITDEDIYIGGIIGSIKAVFELLVFGCPVEWIESSYNELQHLIEECDFHCEHQGQDH